VILIENEANYSSVPVIKNRFQLFCNWPYSQSISDQFKNPFFYIRIHMLGNLWIIFGILHNLFPIKQSVFRKPGYITAATLGRNSNWWSLLCLKLDFQWVSYQNQHTQRNQLGWTHFSNGFSYEFPSNHSHLMQSYWIEVVRMLFFWLCDIMSLHIINGGND
jgi:hypothetical protein